MEVETLQSVARFGTLALGGPLLVCALWWGARMVRRTPRCFCPGPARSLGVWIFPPAWFLQRPCGYDLRGLPESAPGCVTCPECGRTLEPRRRALRGAWRWRPGRAAILLAALVALVQAPVVLKTTSWQRRVPSTALILVSRALGPEATPPRLRRELDRRLELGQLWGWQRSLLLPVLAAELRDDEVHRNAERAVWSLMRLGDAGKEELERALRSDDRQARMLAAETLRDMIVPSEKVGQWRWERRRIVGEPSDELLRATFEQLSSRCSWRTGVEHAWDPYAFLALFPERTLPIALAELEGSDEERRLRAAGLLALMGLAPSTPGVIELLIDHLRDNTEDRDAEFAARALYAIGPDAAEALDRHLYAEDPQQRALVRLVLQNLRKLPDSAGDFPDERALWRATFPGQFDSALAPSP